MRKSFWLKTGIMFGLTLLLLVPLGMIEGLVGERAARQRAVLSDIAASSAGSQQLFGPVLAIPYTEHWIEVLESKADGVPKREEKLRVDNRVLYFFPEQLDLNGSLTTEIKRRGHFKVRSYVLNAEVKGRFSLPAGYSKPKPVHNGRIVIGIPYASVVVTDMRGVLEAPGMSWDSLDYAFERGAELPIDQVSGMHADIGLRTSAEGPVTLPFAFSLKLRGLEELHFVPAGKQTRVVLSSDWPHPSFQGRFLPDPQGQKVGPDGFRASWSVNALASNVAEDFYRCRDIACFDSFGLRLVDPVSIYSLSDRATKYGFLFVCLTFASIFLFEILKSLSIHPAQYTLVGLALAMFFLLLLSLSEHIPFVLAYLVAAAASVGLIAFYLSAVLASTRRGLGAGTLLGGLFACLYGLLQSEDNALMLGSLLLFALLAAAMVATRRVDWYRLGLTPALPEDSSRLKPGEPEVIS